MRIWTRAVAGGMAVYIRAKGSRWDPWRSDLLVTVIVYIWWVSLRNRAQLYFFILVTSQYFIIIHVGSILLTCLEWCNFCVNFVIHTQLARDRAFWQRHHKIVICSPFRWWDVHGFLEGCGRLDTSPQGRAQVLPRGRHWTQASNWEVLKVWHSERWVLLDGRTCQGRKGYSLNGYNIQNWPHRHATCVVHSPYTQKGPQALVLRPAVAILKFLVSFF